MEGAPASHHRTLLAVSALVILASVVLTADMDAVYLAGWPLPESCMSRRIFGVECPGCGMTRAFVHMGHLDWRAAFSLHRLGPLLWLLVAGQIPYRGYLLLRRYSALKGPK